MSHIPKTDDPPIEIEARAVTIYDHLAIFSARSRHYRYERVKRVTHDTGPDMVDIHTSEGMIRLRGMTKVKVASSRGSR